MIERIKNVTVQNPPRPRRACARILPVQQPGEAGTEQLLKNKLRSRTGASLTYALLLFLVCAVVSSVVLAAGTAASGRMSETAQNDRRYYSVTSAAELLRDLLDDGKPVCVVEKGEEENKKVYVLENVIAYDVSEFNEDNTIDPYDLNFSSLAAAAAYKCKVDRNANLNLAISCEDYEVPDVGVTLTSVQDDAVTFTVSSDSTDEAAYTLEVSFSADILSHSFTVAEENGPEMPVTATSYTWRLNSITVGAAS